MFNVSVLLLDDALKPATPLIAPLVSGVAGLSASSSTVVNFLKCVVAEVVLFSIVVLRHFAFHKVV